MMGEALQLSLCPKNGPVLFLCQWRTIMSERETIFDVKDLILGRVKLQRDLGSWFLYVGDRDIEISAVSNRPKITGSGTKLS